jgi:putative FmdB family regulatory protein
MPLYEYECPSCGHPFEKLVSFAKADKLQACPSCGNDRVEKKISRIAAFTGGTTAGSSSAGSAAACNTSFG